MSRDERAANQSFVVFAAASAGAALELHSS